MPIQYHYSNCGHNLAKSTLLKGTGVRLDVPAIYGANFMLNTDAYDDGGNFIHVPCPAISTQSSKKHERHKDAIIVAIDGACRGNGTKDAQSACGVYFGKASTHSNAYWIARAVGEHTNQKAELHACVEALRTVEQIVAKGTWKLKQVVVKSDSDYLVRGVTQHLAKWKTNGFVNAKGREVVNRELFRDIDAKIQSLKAGLGVRVFLWHVSRERNQQADRLANKMLDDAGGDGTDDGTDDAEMVDDGTDDGADDGGTIDDGTDDEIGNIGVVNDGTDDGTDEE